MKIILTLEYIAGLLFSLFLFSHLSYAWWVYPALFFSPDIGIAGYIINTKIGAFTYNLTHHLGVAFVLYMAGYFLNLPILQLFGAVWLGHLFFDRIIGYGLKYSDGFKHTHLGQM
jgi:hypothetical protein